MVIEEAALIDGAIRFRIYWNVFIPNAQTFPLVVTAPAYVHYLTGTINAIFGLRL